MNTKNLRIDLTRLKSRMDAFNQFGKLEGGGVRRLALSDEDKQARDLLKQWASYLGLHLTIDQIGNMFISREKLSGDKPCVMTGSHLDTVGTGGLFDGTLGVAAAMEVMEVLVEKDVEIKQPFVIANFTNEEGVRFTPDMMGSLAFKKGIQVEDLYTIRSVNGNTLLGDELERIGYKGNTEPGEFPVSHFVELHIEQGPVLENEGIDIAAVTKVQGIYWTEYHIQGRSAHAGTTPLALRNDAGYVAARLTTFIRDKARELGGSGTVGIQEYAPNLINVVPERVRLTADIRHPEKEKLDEFQERIDEYLEEICRKEGTSFKSTELVRFTPVDFSEEMVSLIEKKSKDLGYYVKQMISGAGHDAQMMAAVCPASMIFVPSANGISHNIEEFTKDEDLERGANVLLHVILELVQN